MAKKTLIILIGAAVFAAVAAWIFLSQKSDIGGTEVIPPVAPSASLPSPAPVQSLSPLPLPVSVPTPQSAIQTVVTYTDLGFSPSMVSVERGGSVIFMNESSKDVWPASAIHPSHKAYPTTGGCIGSTFDACKPLKPGEEWSFTFDISGTWKYHNHINPSHTGTVLVL